MDSTMGLVDSALAPDTCRYLETCHLLAESMGTKVREKERERDF